MAVLDLLAGVTAEIVVKGVPAQEHNDPDEIQAQHSDSSTAEYQKKRTVSKYIQSETGAKFAVKCAVGFPFVKNNEIPVVMLGFHIFVDGHLAGKIMCSRTEFKGKGRNFVWTDELKGVEEVTKRKGFVREFSFASITTHGNSAEAALVKRLAQKLKMVGTIEIKVYNQSRGRPTGSSEATSEGFISEKGTLLPEKVMKGGDDKKHGVALHQPQAAKPHRKFDNVLKDGIDFPLAIFRFFYRDEESLKQMQIIQKQPSPSPSPLPSRNVTPEPEEEPIPDFTEAEKEAIIARALQEANEKRAAEIASEREAKKAASKASGRSMSVDKIVQIKRERAEEQKEADRAAKRAKTVRESELGKEGPIYISLLDSDDEDDEDD